MKVLRNASLYLLLDVVNKAIPFFLLPILTIYLIPGSYGNLSLFTVFLAFISPLVMVALDTNIARNYYTLDKKALGKLVFNLQIIGIVAMCIVTLGGWIFSKELQDILPIPVFFYWFIPLCIFLDAQTGYLYIFQLCDEDVVGYGVFKFMATIINVSVSLLLVISFKMDWIGRVYGILGSMALIGISSFCYLLFKGYIRIELDWQLIKRCLSISLPLIPNALAGVVINLSDRLFIEELVSKEILGIYSVGYSLGMIMSFLAVAFRNAIVPWIFKRLQTASPENEFKRQLVLVRFTYLFMIFLVILALSITLFTHILINIGFLPETYTSAKVYIVWICLSYACQGMMFIIFPYLSHSGKTTYYFPLSVLAAVVNLVGNYYFIHMYGAIGAAYSTLIAYLILLIGAWVYAQKVYPMPWLDKRAWNFNFQNIRTLFDED